MTNCTLHPPSVVSISALVFLHYTANAVKRRDGSEDEENNSWEKGAVCVRKGERARGTEKGRKRGTLVNSSYNDN